MDALNFFQSINNFVWGPPLLMLLVGTGFYLTIRLGLLQILKLPLALKYLFAKDKDDQGEGDVSSFAALCTALAATIGTGNIVGVATAIKLGGPGALFWMWLAAFFGMATKFTIFPTPFGINLSVVSSIPLFHFRISPLSMNCCTFFQNH